MSDSRRRLSGYDVAMAEYWPMAGYRRPRSRQDRPLSDGDLWAIALPVDVFPHRNITDHSCLKVYHKDPAQAFSHGPRPTNGDARVSTKLTTPLGVPLKWGGHPSIAP